MSDSFTNHLYQFKGQVYKQKDGGPIGDNATNIAADLIMCSFIGGYRQKLQKLGLNDSIKLLKVYVDDLNQVARCLPVGPRYMAGKLYVPGEGWKGRSPPGQAISATRRTEIEQEADGQSREGSTRENQEKKSAEL